MLDAIRENTADLEAIARGSRTQASAIEEVTIAVRQMDEMTQHNAALVEETNAAIEQTEGQASQLDRIVEQFTVSAPPARAPEPAPARGIKGMQDKLKSAASNYLRRPAGNAAPKMEDWSEF